MSDLQVDIIIRITNHFISSNTQPTKPNDIKQLIKIKGIGPWTINCTNIMYNLNADDNDFDNEILYQDLIIRRGIKKLYNITAKEDILKLSEKWSPWKGLVTWYLWKEFT